VLARSLSFYLSLTPGALARELKSSVLYRAAEMGWRGGGERSRVAGRTKRVAAEREDSSRESQMRLEPLIARSRDLVFPSFGGSTCAHSIRDFVAFVHLADCNRRAFLERLKVPSTRSVREPEFRSWIPSFPIWGTRSCCDARHRSKVIIQIVS